MEKRKPDTSRESDWCSSRWQEERVGTNLKKKLKNEQKRNQKEALTEHKKTLLYPDSGQALQEVAQRACGDLCWYSKWT